MKAAVVVSVKQRQSGLQFGESEEIERGRERQREREGDRQTDRGREKLRFH